MCVPSIAIITTSSRLLVCGAGSSETDRRVARLRALTHAPQLLCLGVILSRVGQSVTAQCFEGNLSMSPSFKSPIVGEASQGNTVPPNLLRKTHGGKEEEISPPPSLRGSDSVQEC
ncbi:unnamed protein product [Hymenolepis diminuta]|uniref:Secreted protein n=1 Tax=Hymenolepis diminuta TaxID=6216 RepID=A0A0R3SHA6_HYMDI|nr:unnamed protein product [Hymenolepis diminuta]